jgi:hypothetical protein
VSLCVTTWTASFNEPAEGKKKSQIEEYLNLWRTWNSAYRCATDDIGKSIETRGIEFLSAPPRIEAIPDVLVRI